MAEKKKKHLPALDKRQRDFVFKTSTKFAPVGKEEVQGANHLLEQLAPHISLIRQFDPQDASSGSCRGMIFYGPSGTGKTYLARHVATATGARFIDAREFPREESDEQQWTRYDIKFLFALLKKYVSENGKPIILFWDQFDEFISNVEDDPEVMSQLYVELDGLEGSAAGIVFIAASVQEPQYMDEQLVRPGRLGYHFRFDYPSKKGRAEILRFYLNQRPHKNFDAESMIELLNDDLSQAGIKQLVEIAYDNSSLRPKPYVIERDDLLKAIMDKLIGKAAAIEAEKTPKARRRIAIHELGHALIAWILGRPVTVVSTITAGTDLLGGLTLYDLLPEGYFPLANWRRDRITVSLGGFIAERVAGYKGDVGQEADLANATGAAYELVRKFAAGEKTHQDYGTIAPGTEKISQDLMRTFETDVADFLKDGELKATEILKGVGKDKIVQLAKVLSRKKVLLRDEIDDLFQKHGIQKR